MSAVACTSGRVALNGRAPTASASAGTARPIGAAFSARSHTAHVSMPKSAVSSRTLSASRKGAFIVRAAEAEAETKVTYETYERELTKPLMVKFARGNDGCAYVIQIVPGAPKEYDEFEVGDRISKVSASFGSDVWAAENYGQVMYAVKTRSGGVFFELEKRGGDMTIFEPKAKKDSQFNSERNSGNYGSGTQALQMKRFVAAKELADQRVEMFNEALGLFKAKKFDESLVIFENVVGLEPAGFIGDNMSKVTDIYRVAQYNVACCYSMIKQEDAALDALKSCLMSGFDNYKMVRSDPSLEFLRGSEDFKPLINKFDEPLINENAMKVLKGMFGKK